MADGVLLLVDAAEGPMPQTRFVLDKALKLGIKPIVFINKIDREDRRPEVVLDMVFDLFVELGASDEQLDFPTIYGSAKGGFSSKDENCEGADSMLPLLDVITEYVPQPKVIDGPVQMQVTTLDYSNFLGKIGVGRVYRGTLSLKKPIKVIKKDGSIVNSTIKKLFVFEGLAKKEVEEVYCGDLCTVVGITDIEIGDTICDAENPEVLPKIKLDEPTISMNFRTNDSPLFGKEGKFVTGRQLEERLYKESETDIALRIDKMEDGSWNVNGRGVLHISILVEQMRREGYEMAIAKPRAIIKEIDGKKMEPFENLLIDSPDSCAGKIIELVNEKKGEIKEINQANKRQVLEFSIPTRGLLGLRSKIMSLSSGEAIVNSSFDAYKPLKGSFAHRKNGTMISASGGRAEAFAINALQIRGKFFIDPNIECYEGMVVGENSKEGDLIVNMQKAKQLTNVRASGTDKAVKVTPAIKMSLEESFEYINGDELVEVTPLNIRLRKIFLKEVERKRNGKIRV